MYCKFCAAEIDDDCVVCPKCGKQVGQLEGASNQPIIINNSSSSSASAAASAAATVVGVPRGKMCNFLRGLWCT